MKETSEKCDESEIPDDHEIVTCEHSGITFLKKKDPEEDTHTCLYSGITFPVKQKDTL